MSGRKNSKKAVGAAKKPALTHFLCVPLVNSSSRSQLDASLQRFRNDVCPTSLLTEDMTESSTADVSQPEQAPSSGIAEKAIRPVGALHLTLGVMSLDDETLKAAVVKMKQLDIAALLTTMAQPDLSSSSAGQEQASPIPRTLAEPISPPPTAVLRSTSGLSAPEARRTSVSTFSPITITLRSLISMHAPSKTSILYAEPFDPTSRLYPLCNAIRSQFQAEGYLVHDDRPLKLHATIVNTIYAKSRKRAKQTPNPTTKALSEDKSTTHHKSEDPNLTEQPSTNNDEQESNAGHGPTTNAPLKIDARALIPRYENHIWAENVVLDRICICEMGAKKILNEKGDVVAEEYLEVARAELLT